MKIIKLNLYTNQLEPQKHFFTHQLGFDLIAETNHYFTVKIGWSELSFTKSQKAPAYHYCFLIPSNQLEAGMKWLEARTEVVLIEPGRKIQHFESWNAHSCYFYDASGNLAEFIVRYDLNNEQQDQFSSSSILCVNEIGMPTTNIEQANATLKDMLHTEFWKGDLDRFGTHGDQEGIFLLPNYNIKDKWFPTQQIARPEPFEVIVENAGVEYGLQFQNETIATLPLQPFPPSYFEFK